MVIIFIILIQSSWSHVRGHQPCNQNRDISVMCTLFFVISSSYQPISCYLYQDWNYSWFHQPSNRYRDTSAIMDIVRGFHQSSSSSQYRAITVMIEIIPGFISQATGIVTLPPLWTLFVGFISLVLAANIVLLLSWLKLSVFLVSSALQPISWYFCHGGHGS